MVPAVQRQRAPSSAISSIWCGPIARPVRRDRRPSEARAWRYEPRLLKRYATSRSDPVWGRHGSEPHRRTDRDGARPFSIRIERERITDSSTGEQRRIRIRDLVDEGTPSVSCSHALRVGWHFDQLLTRSREACEIHRADLLRCGCRAKLTGEMNGVTGRCERFGVVPSRTIGISFGRSGRISVCLGSNRPVWIFDRHLDSIVI